MNSESRIIGIDLGTTNSVVAVVLGTEPEVIPNTEGSNKTPSVVAFLENGEVVVGEIARRQASTNPLRTISSIKRLMGRSFEEVEESGEVFPYQLVSHDGEVLVDIDGMGYRPEQISALILKKMKESAESYLGEELTQAVITVPAYFDDLQRQATIEAASMAGLEVLRLINEPTAAAMAYGLGRGEGNEEIVAVYDFGGGTFDITILEIHDKTFEVLTSTGDSRLGGDDLDNAIVQLVIDDFMNKHGVALTQDAVTIRRLKEVAERAKCELSTMNQTNMALPFIAYRDNQPLHLDFVLHRDEFEELIDEYVRRTIRCCRRALDDAQLNKTDISRIIMVGGTTRIPLVQDSVEEFFDQGIFKGVNPDEVVALGAATQAGVFEGNIQEVILLDVTPHSLGIEVEGGKFSQIIEKNSTIPIKAAKTFTTTDDSQEFVNVHVLQGEATEAAENRSLGKFSLTGLPPSAAGVPRIRVTFFINADGVMEISAEDMNTGMAEAITIVHSQLSEEEQKKRSRRRSRSRRRGSTTGSSRRGTGSGSSSGSSRRRENIPGAESMPFEGQPIGADQTGSGIRAGTGTPEQTREEKQAFAVLGDTQPGTVQQGVRSRDNVDRSMSPVDYSKVPPMYSHMQQQTTPESRPAPPAQPSIPVPPMVQPSTATPPVSNDGQTRHSAQTQPNEITLPDPHQSETHWSPPPDLNRPEPTDGFNLEVPQILTEAISLAESGQEDDHAQEMYTKAISILKQTPFDVMDKYTILRAKALLHSMAGQLEETRGALKLLRELHMNRHGEDILVMHENALERFGATPLLRDRGQAKEALGDLLGACADFELAIRQEPETTDRDYLERLYRIRSKEDDPQAKFKLVKVLLKNNDVDEAIQILEDLQHFEGYENRALKVLGLCHWQKNMHYLAWQKFKTLPVDDDLKDILYRLACDMEGSDQLHNAVAVLEHLSKQASGYRDAEARLRKLNYRLKLQQEEMESQRDVPILGRDSRFVIIEEINRGSMGIIYKAEDKTLNEIVALKILNDYLCSDPSAVERFKSEARAAKKLSHPYIVRIHDMFESDSKRLISMEYIEGNDLKRMLSERTAFTEEMIIYYFMQICDALSYAHKMNIVHRDIKPANIMITKDNTVKITDFGIAKIMHGQDATKSGTAVIGTPLYMAPEQIIGEPVDGRTDIYSLGIMMYEMVSGNPPFYLGNIEYHHIHTAPPPLPEKVSQKIRDIIMQMIAKAPEDRFQSVGELIKEVRS